MKGGLFGSLPIAGTDVATHWDALYYFLFYLSLFLFVLVIGAMLIFAIKYRARPGHVSTPSPRDHHLLEFVWTAIPTVLVMVIFVWGWIVYKDMVSVPKDAYEVRVIGQRWSWIFQYEDGRTTNNQLFVPANRPIKLTMTAKTDDVLHSFFVPDFRIKQDVVPGMYTYVWFTAKTPAQHQIFCTEYCGTGHSAMLAKVVVLAEDQWKLWWSGKEIDLPESIGIGSYSSAALSIPAVAEVTGDQSADLVNQGKALSQSKGCVACHSDDGSKRIGPTWKGIWGRKEELTDGSWAVVDENYVKESTEKPQAKIVKGYENVVMPPYNGQLSSAEFNALIAYMKSLK